MLPASHPHSSDDSTLLKVGLTMYTKGYIAGLQKNKELVDVGEEISQQNTQLLEDIRSLTQSSVLITAGNEVAVSSLRKTISDATKLHAEMLLKNGELFSSMNNSGEARTALINDHERSIAENNKKLSSTLVAIQVIKDEVNKLKDELEAKENGILGLQIKIAKLRKAFGIHIADTDQDSA